MHQIIFLKIKHKYDSILQTEKIVQNIMKWYALSFKARSQGQWQQALSLFVTVSICLSLFLCLTYTGIFVFPEQAHLCMVSQLCNYLAVFFFFNTDFLVVIYQLWFLCSFSPLLSYDPLSLGNRYDIDTTFMAKYSTICYSLHCAQCRSLC